MTKISLLLMVVIFGLFSCDQKIDEKEENIGTNPDTSRDSEGDTFSIVAYDKTTGQVGGAACSCVSYTNGIDFLSDLITDGTTSPNNIVGAIHSQAAYNATTQAFARNRMLAGDTPQQIIDATVASDGSSASRQYGVVGVDNPGAAGFSGSSNGNYANDQQGDNAFYTYSIQGNILDVSNGQDLLDDIEAIFNSTDGTLGDKLMAAMQAAKRVGGDNRCQSRGNSGRTAFVQVLSPGETSPGLIYDIGDTTAAVADMIEPIDQLQCLYDIGENTPFCRQTVTSFPYSMDFELKPWEQEVATCSVNSSWIRSRFSSPSSGTGPAGANQGTLYSFVESSDVGGQGTAPREAMIGSPCFVIPAAHTASMTFDYHMLGAAMGTLSVEASNNGGTSWTTLWSRTGDQGSSWFNDEPIDLSSYAGSTVKIRIKALLGNGFTSDMAIDDIQISIAPIAICTGVTKTWNGSSWSPSGAPTLVDDVIINGDYTTGTDGDLLACTLTVNDPYVLTISSGGFTTVNTDITIDGSLIVEHTGSVVQVEESGTVTKNATTGIINVALTTPPLKKRDFMVMGSPMNLETRTDVFASAFLVLQHTPGNFIPHAGVPAGGTNFADDNGDFWNQYAAGPINVGEGYIVRPQAGYNDPIYINPGDEFTFDMTFAEGTLNNGNIVRPVTFNGLGSNPDGTPNVLANPYASAIDASLLINDVDNSLLNEIYLWEHLTPPSTSIPGANSQNFSMDDISMYNGTMGIPAANDTGTSTTPNGVISTGQGFGVKAYGTGNITFKNTMRLTTGNSTLRTPQGLEKLTLKISNEEFGLGSYTGIAFSDTATAGLDPKFDSNRLATFISLYSHLVDVSEQLGIQTRETFNSEIKIPLGYASQVAAETTFKISIADVEGDHLSNADIYLYDNQENVLTNLSTDDYEFKSNKGQFDGRFTLSFEKDEILGSQEEFLQRIEVYPNPTDELLTIYSPASFLSGIVIYDLRGRSLTEQLNNDQKKITINLSALQTGIYFVKIDTEAGTITKKIIKK